MQSGMTVTIAIMMAIMIGTGTVVIQRLGLTKVPSELKGRARQNRMRAVETHAGKTTSCEVPHRFSNLILSIQLYGTEILYRQIGQK